MKSVEQPISGTLESHSNTLTVRELTSFADAEPLRDAWNNLVIQSNADIYQTFDWCRIWWSYYGKLRHLSILLYFEGEQLVGVLPMFTETLGFGPFRIRVGKIVGSDFSLNLCNPAIISPFVFDIISSSINYFFTKYSCDAIVIGPCSGNFFDLDKISAAETNKYRHLSNICVLGDECNTYFDLPNSFDEYLSTLDKDHRKQLKRRMTHFSKTYAVTSDFVSSPSAVVSEFESFSILHTSQWNAINKLGHFNDWPYALEFNRELVKCLGAQGQVRFHRLMANNKVICSHYSFAHGTTNYARLTGRLYGPEWDKYGLGALGAFYKTQALITEGVKTVEAGRGHYTHKITSGGREMPLRSLQFTRRGSEVETRIRLFKLFSRFLNVAYYKILFLRVSPHFSRSRRSLWPTWIRSQW